MGKTETEVSRWLCGTHNLTMCTIAKLSIALDDDLIMATTTKKRRKINIALPRKVAAVL